jgi:hypothetical protein
MKDRILRLDRVLAGELVPNPKNWREHPASQAEALKGVLEEVGFAGAVIVRELADGSLQILDGHLRAGVDPDSLVPVLVVDVSDAEADKVLATYDTITGMAEADPDALREMLLRVQTESEGLSALLNNLAESVGGLLEAEGGKSSGAAVPDGEDEFAGDGPELDESEGVDAIPGLRMVQLFLDDTTIQQFEEWVYDLMAHYEKDNLTDTVMEAVVHAHGALP